MPALVVIPVERVSSSYKDAYQAGERANNALRQVQKDIDVLVKNIKPLTSIDQVKDTASSLLRDSGLLSIHAMCNPFSFSSTLQIPSVPKNLAKSVKLCHFVAFM
jgi:hypothetical protein